MLHGIVIQIFVLPRTSEEPLGGLESVEPRGVSDIRYSPRAPAGVNMAQKSLCGCLTRAWSAVDAPFAGIVDVKKGCPRKACAE